MDLERHLLDLVGGVRPGDELWPGARLLRVSAELGWKLTVLVGGTEVHVEIARREPGRPHAAATDRLAISYRLDRGGPGHDPGDMRALCEALAARIAPREERVLEDVRVAAEQARASGDDHGRVREVRGARLLEPMGSGAERFHGLSPYAGCLIGCRFCYAQSRLRQVRRLQLLDEQPWGSYVDVRVDAPDVLRAELQTQSVEAIKLCPILSDPYQAIERRYRLTRRCLEVLRDDGRPRLVLLLTRSTLVVEDAELLASIDGARAGFSLPTVDEEVARHFEPRAASIGERLSALRALRAAGVPTFAIVQPLLPGSIDAHADALAAHVGSVRLDVLRGVEGASREFADPRYAHAADDAWQRDRAAELGAALRARGVAVWSGELPPRLSDGR